MSRCARDFTKFLFSQSLSDFSSKKEHFLVPKTNNSFQKVLEIVVGSPLIFLQAWAGIFIALIIRYVTFVPKPCCGGWGCKAATYLTTWSVKTSEDLRCPINRRQHSLQSCAGLSPLTFEPYGSSVCLGLMSSNKKRNAEVKCELLAVSYHESYCFLLWPWLISLKN
jgi:hypothetical protein